MLLICVYCSFDINCVLVCMPIRSELEFAVMTCSDKEVKEAGFFDDWWWLILLIILIILIIALCCCCCCYLLHRHGDVYKGLLLPVSHYFCQECQVY